MSDDNAMDDLLRTAMSAAPPQPSPAFQATVMRRVAQRRMSRPVKAVLGGYGAASVVLSAWLLQGFPAVVLVAGLGAAAAAAAAAWLYASRLSARA